MPDNEVKLDLRKLDSIQKELKKVYVTKVGILSKKNARVDYETNASIGLVHEFGSLKMNIDSRSFLRMPLHLKLPKVLNEIGQGLIDEMTTKNMKTQYKKLGVIAEGIIQEAFATGGFGKWQRLQASTIKHKKSNSILIDSGQLRNSITSEVKTK